MTRVDNSLTEMIVGKWIHADTDGETVTTDMKSVYTFEKNGDALKVYYSMSMTESGVWAHCHFFHLVAYYFQIIS